MAPLVNRFNKAKNAKDKNKILDELRRVIDSEGWNALSKEDLGAYLAKGIRDSITDRWALLMTYNNTEAFTPSSILREVTE